MEMNERESAIHDKAFGLGVRAGWNAAHASVYKPVTFMGITYKTDVPEPDESCLRSADRMICEANNLLTNEE